MKKSLLLFFTVALACTGFSQDISITTGWKFRTGDDSVSWAAPSLDESAWKPIEPGKSWEAQGFTGYDGFAWYRLHIRIPSAIRTKSYLKDSLRIDLGSISNGNEVYLNGEMIGRNFRNSPTIKSGRRGARSYLIAANNPAIKWDGDNVLAVRVWNANGAGGLLEGTYGISMLDVTDFASLNLDSSFHMGTGGELKKMIVLQSAYEGYGYKGKLHVTLTDPASGTQLLDNSVDVGFSKSSPYRYLFRNKMPENKSYLLTYQYTETQTGKQLVKSETTPYLLTPAVSVKPRINGPSVYGARPGRPFLYKIPASGQKPLRYAVSKLPAGLQLDPSTGIITGTSAKAGSYPVKLTARNKAGADTKDFTIVIGDRIGLTPALGWNSWNAWGVSVSDEKVRISAKAMADHLSDHGWAYINIDDGWEAPERASTGEIVTNEKFPDMKGLSTYVHGLGLKLGIYSSPGPRTCGGFLGSYQHEEQDAKTWGDWGIDYLKYDWCSYSQVAANNTELPELQKPYTLMRTALNKVNRDIMFSLCQYGWGDVWKWGGEIGGNSWRTTGDITDTWASLSRIGFTQDKGSPYAQPGNYNDPDMLVVGKVGWGPRLHNSRLTADEQYTHFSLWSLLASPLLIGCDMGQLDDFTMNLLTNDEVLALDQDALGKQAFKLYDKDSIQVWVKDLQDGSKAFGIFNLSLSQQKPTISFSDLQMPGQVHLRDVWRQKDLGSFSGSYSTSLPAHGVVLLRSNRIGESGRITRR